MSGGIAKQEEGIQGRWCDGGSWVVVVMRALFLEREGGGTPIIIMM